MSFTKIAHGSHWLDWQQIHINLSLWNKFILKKSFLKIFVLILWELIVKFHLYKNLFLQLTILDEWYRYFGEQRSPNSNANFLSKFVIGGYDKISNIWFTNVEIPDYLVWQESTCSCLTASRHSSYGVSYSIYIKGRLSSRGSQPVVEPWVAQGRTQKSPLSWLRFCQIWLILFPPLLPQTFSLPQNLQHYIFLCVCFLQDLNCLIK